MTTNQDFFLPSKPEEPKKSPKLSDRILGVLGRAKDIVRETAENNATNFRGLVNLLAEYDFSGKGKLPAAEKISAILEAGKKTPDDLADAVEVVVSIKQIREELKTEPAAIQALEEIKATCNQEDQEYERQQAARIVRVDQLIAERNECDEKVRRFSSLRSELQTLWGGYSSQVDDIDGLIIESQKQEALIMSRAGSIVLPERYVKHPMEHFRKELDALKTSVDKRLPRDSHVQPGPRLLEDKRQLETLEAEWPKVESLCKLGEQVREERRRRKELVAERAELMQQESVAFEAVESPAMAAN